MLEARKISFAYPGASTPLYHDFSFALEAGERVALRAPSGFGKTSLCRLLAGFEKPSSGEVLVDGAPLPTKGVCPVQLIGQHPEFAVDPRMRLRETLTEAGAVDGSILRALGIRDEWQNRFPHELSGGELQRFCIARAVASRPRYLIADEISTMLDALTQAQIWSFLLDYVEQEKLGLAFVSHSDALTQRIATRVVDLAQIQ